MAKRRTIHSRRDALQANQEKRGGRVLKAFRRVDQEDAELLGGALIELTADSSIPPIKPVNRGYQTFIFDPRLMAKGDNERIMSGIQIGRLLERLKYDNEIVEDGFAAPLGEIMLLPKNRTTVLARLESERLTEERMGFYRLLGKSGVKGFNASGVRNGHRIERPTIAIANFKQPVAKIDEAEISSTIDAALEVQLGVSKAPSVNLGELEIRSYQAR